MEIKIQFRTSQKNHPKFQNISVGKYTIEPIPSNLPNLQHATNLYLLRFQDEMREGERMTNPKAEGELFLSCLSLFLSSKLQIEGLMMNSVNTPSLNQIVRYKDYEIILEELPDLNLLLKKLMSKKIDIAKQFIRSCEVYRTAINLISENTTLSYFLFTIAIECLSNIVISEGKKCDKFIAFILKYLPDKSDLESEEDWREFLKEIYYNHRSGFIHGGKEIPEGVILADKLNRTYIRNVIDGKEVRTPGLKWFEKKVRLTLIGFLMSDEYIADSEIDHFKEFSLEDGKIMLKAKRAINAFQPVLVKEDDFQLD